MQSTAKRPSRAAKVVYPELPDGDHPAFWLAAFLRDHAELDEIRKIQQANGHYKKPQSYQFALISATRMMRQEMKVSQGYVVKNGLLPFAHPHTTYFDQQVAA